MSYFRKLKDIIKEKRPKLRESSIDLYARNMRKLSKLNDEDEFENVNFLDNPSNIANMLKDKSLHTRKTYYSSIVVVLMALDKEKELIDKYRKEMEELQEFYIKEKDSNKKSEKMNKNWVEYTDLIKVMDNLRKKVSYEKIFKKENPTKKEKSLVQQLVIASLYLLEPEDNPPVRLDYIMKVIPEKEYKSIENPKENYLVIKSRNHKYFSFNDYKTSGTYKDKEIKVGKKLNSLLNNWLKINNSGYLLLNNKDEPLSSNGLTKALNKVFESTNKNISASMIRHAYLTDRYSETTEDKKIIADAMLHSVQEQSGYIKTD